ncbi:MAG: hypothetical protein AAFV45_01815 [Pseudomonadota bacterium]
MFPTIHLRQAVFKHVIWPSDAIRADSDVRPPRILDLAAGLACAAMLTIPLAVAPDVAVDDMISQAQSDNDGTAAQAATDAASDKRAAYAPQREFVIGAYTGSPYTYDSTVTLNDGGDNAFQVDGVQWRGEPFIDPIYYGIRIQRWFEGGRTGTMLDFTHSKAIGEKEEDIAIKGLLDGETVDATKKLNEVFDRLEFSHGHNMLTLNGLFRLANLGPRLSPYVGIGAGVNLPHAEAQLQTADTRTYEYQYTGPVVQGLIGIEFRVPRLSYYLEYKFSFASYDMPLSGLDGTEIGLFADLYRQFANWWSGEPPPGGRLQTQLLSHQWIGGVGFRIATPSPADVPAAP